MPKLNKTTAASVNKASSTFEPIPDGVYHARLRDVDGSRSGPKGPYWSWEFEVVEPGDYTNRRLWNNTSLSPDSQFSFKQTFDAFGVDPDTDTDEICGKVVRLQVSTRTIQEGARKGDPANQIDRVMPAEDDFELPAELAAAGAGQKDADDIF